MSLLRRAVEGIEQRDFTSRWMDVVYRRQRGADRGPVTESQALRLTTVWACIALKADTFTGLPVGAFRDVDTARVPLARDPDVLVTPTGATVEWPEWIGMALVSYEARGNTLGQILEYDRQGYPRSIQLLHPDEVKVWFDNDLGVPLYGVPGIDEPQRRYPVGDVWHVKGLTLPGIRRSILGLNPIEHAALTIGRAIGAEEFGANFFGDAALPAGYLSSDQDIDDEEALDMSDRWHKQHGDRRRRIAVLGSGLKFEALSIKPNEAQFLETIGATRTDICGFFRVPPHMVGIVDRSTSWGTGIEEQTLGFITYTIGGPLVRFERALSSLLPRPQYVKFNLAGLLRGRLTERYRAYLMGRQGGWLSIDDIRALEEMQPIPDGRGGDYLMPLNYAPIPPGGGQPELPPPPPDEDEEA